MRAFLFISFFICLLSPLSLNPSTETIVVQLLEQQGLELIFSMGELVDIDIQHAVERVINQLKTPGGFCSFPFAPFSILTNCRYIVGATRIQT